MMRTPISIRLLPSLVALLLLAGTIASAQTDSLEKVLDRTSQRVSEFLDEFSNVKCTEQVIQEKFKPNGKRELEQQSSYDYLVMLTNAGGDMSVNESRLPVKEAKVNRRQNISMLLSNGFATLFLVFHPYYINGFEFTDAGGETLDGHAARKIHFRHIPNTRSVAALALRGREYPLELSGTVWVDPQNGNILRIEAGIGSTLEDIGMKTLQSSVRFAPAAFSKDKDKDKDKNKDKDQPVYWFPTEAVVEVETPKQHWRNTHRFLTYKQFSVAAEEHVAEK
jgi:outer membrane lipoprotein-sorting protein